MVETTSDARALRVEFEDAFYHLYTRGNRRERIFASDKDYLRFDSELKPTAQ